MKSKTSSKNVRDVKKTGEDRRSDKPKRSVKAKTENRQAKVTPEKAPVKPSSFDPKLNRNARKARDKFIPDPKDANTVNALREKLRIIQEYKKLLAKDGLFADSADKELESNIIKQLIRIEKGLSPTKPGEGRKKLIKKRKKKKPNSQAQSSSQYVAEE